MSRELNLLVIFQYLLHLTSQNSIIIVEEQSAGGGCQPCYRKLFAGKRLAEIHVRRALNCERIEECSRECDSEKGFLCEGFNYRQQGVRRGTPSRGNGNGVCELTSMPPSQIDISRDILHEPRYDYYERDIRCNNKQRPYPPSHSIQESGWIDVVRPSQEERPYFQRPIEIPRPIRPTIEVPRPLVNDYLPKRPFHVDDGPQPPLNWRPDQYPRRIPPLNIRPIEDDVRFEYFGPGRPYQSPKDRPQSRPDITAWYRPHHHDFGANEIEPYRPDRRKDSVNGYAGVYGYKTNNIEGYEGPNRGNFVNRDKRPLDKNSLGIYSYGGAFGYGENHVPNNRDVVYPGYNRRPELCSVRSGGGFKLRRGIVIKSYLTPSLDHCENLCAIEKECVCMTFSYRYSLAANAPTDNCLLSEISYRDLDFYNDLEPDRDYDIYSMTGDLKSCGNERPVNQRPPEECFWRVRSGCGVPPEVVRKAIHAHGLGDCEAECVEARSFTCRSFVYRYGQVHSSSGGEREANCFLSDWPSQEIDPLSLPEVDDAELYQRGSFGRGCEPSPFPPLNHRRIRPQADNRPVKKDEVCYAEYQKPCRLTPQAVMLTIYVPSEFECRERCSYMRERDQVPCMSFSYRISGDREEHNCFMSDVPHRDLRPGIDYVLGDGHLLFAWKEFDPECDAGYSVGIYIDEAGDSHGKRPGGYSDRPSTGLGPYYPHFEPPFDPEPRPGRPHVDRYPPQTPDFDYHRPPGGRPFPPSGHGSYGTNSRPNNEGGYSPGRPLNPDRPDRPVGPSYEPGGDKRPIESPGFYGGGSSFHDTDDRYGHGHGHGYSENRYNDFSHKHGGSTFEHFTVNGRPCKRGTRCERNKVAGFWSCEPEGGDYGTWDYCCEPKHHCGYSQGYHYPWCYVGPFEDQWRPCSEKYYPYLPSHRPGRPSSDRYDVEDPYGEVPRPGLLGRHWPVAYLHREAPPNATDSFATSDNRRNRQLENSSQIDKTSSRTLRESYNDSSWRSETRAQNYQSIDQGDSHSTTGNSRLGKIERITRFSGSQIDRDTRKLDQHKSLDLITGRNSSKLDARHRKSAEDREELDEIVDLKEFIGRADDIGANGFNRTSKTSSNWSGTTFIRLPTISTNKTEGTSFEDYFEVVNVQ